MTNYKGTKDKVLKAFSNKEVMAPKEVSKLTGVNHNSVRRIVRELAREGYLLRLPNSTEYKMK